MHKPLTIHFFVQFINKQGTFFRYHNWAIELKNLGHTVRVFGASYEKGEKTRIETMDGITYYICVCGYPLRSMFGNITHPISAFRRLFVKYPNCDIAHLFQPHLSAFLPWYFNRKKAKQNFYDWDDLWTDGLAKKGKSFLQTWVFNQVKFIEKRGPKIADTTTVCSHFLAAKSDVFGAKSIEIVYNGFRNYIPNTKSVSRVNSKLKEDAFYLGFMGRTTNEIRWCFELLKILIKKYPFIRLALCGMPEDCMAGIDENIKNNVDYLGFLKPVETKDFASSLDIGLLPLENDLFNQSRFPIKFAEYIAAGTPILTTNVGECATIATHFNFSRIAEASEENWCLQGTQMVEELLTGNFFSIDREKIDKILNWKQIVLKLEDCYLKQ